MTQPQPQPQPKPQTPKQLIKRAQYALNKARRILEDEPDSGITDVKGPQIKEELDRLAADADYLRRVLERGADE